MEIKNNQNYLAKWFINRKQKVIWIHQDVAGRKRFLILYWILLIILILFFASSAACFGLCGFKYDYDSDTATGHLNSLPLFVSGIVLFLLSVIYGIYVAIYLPILFKESRSLYMQTNQYQENVKRLAMMDLSKLTTKEIKWNYKLGFINKTTFLYHKHQLKKAKRN